MGYIALSAGLAVGALGVMQLFSGVASSQEANAEQKAQAPYGLDPQSLAETFAILNNMDCDLRLRIEGLFGLPRLDFRNLAVGIRIFNDRIVLVTPNETMYGLAAAPVSFESQTLRLLYGNQLNACNGLPDERNYFAIILDLNAQNALQSVLIEWMQSQ